MEDGDTAQALVPRWDPTLGRYDWEAPAPETGGGPLPTIEPAFIRSAVEQSFDEVRAPVGVTTFGDVYPRGTRDHALTDAPSPEDFKTFDPLDEWRVAGDVADDILIALPDSTPRMVRTLLTLLMGAMRRK